MRWGPQLPLICCLAALVLPFVGWTPVTSQVQYGLVCSGLIGAVLLFMAPVAWPEHDPWMTWVL